MTDNLETKKILINEYQKYPKLQIQDILKFLFQSSFGCNHMLSSLEFVTDCIIKEADSLKQYNNVLVEQLDGYYSRVNLSYLEKGLSAETLGKLFYVSAKKEENGLDSLTDKLKATDELIKDGLLPFSIEDFKAMVNTWSKQDYPAIHHSDIFINEYMPAYRVISNEYIPYLPLFAEIDKILINNSVAITFDNDNNEISKIIKILLKIYDRYTIYIDEFFENQEDIKNEILLNNILNIINQKELFYYPEFKCSLIKIDSSNNTNKTLSIIKGIHLENKSNFYFQI
ncbi:MAG: hypothetical protein ACOX1L_02815 [Erysipelotrichaceae bacterium]|jgi:hypothetical protein